MAGFEGKVARIAERRVEDLGRDLRLRAELAVIAHRAAVERWEELCANTVALAAVLGSRDE